VKILFRNEEKIKTFLDIKKLRICFWQMYPAAAAAAAKSLQSCPTLCDPIDGSPPSSSVHGIFQARVLEWVAIAFSINYLLIINANSHAFLLLC